MGERSIVGRERLCSYVAQGGSLRGHPAGRQARLTPRSSKGLGARWCVELGAGGASKTQTGGESGARCGGRCGYTGVGLLLVTSATGSAAASRSRTSSGENGKFGQFIGAILHLAQNAFKIIRARWWHGWSRDLHSCGLWTRRATLAWLCLARCTGAETMATP